MVKLRSLSLDLSNLFERNKGGKVLVGKESKNDPAFTMLNALNSV